MYCVGFSRTSDAVREDEAVLAADEVLNEPQHGLVKQSLLTGGLGEYFGEGKLVGDFTKSMRAVLVGV